MHIHSLGVGLNVKKFVKSVNIGNKHDAPDTEEERNERNVIN